MFAGTGLSEFQGNFNLTEATAEDVEGYIDGLKRHDKILWIGVPQIPQNGVKVAGNTRFGADKNHNAKGWLKRTYFKARIVDWQLIEDGCQLEIWMEFQCRYFEGGQ